MSQRIFVAGATGVIGIRLVPLLLAEGHTVAAMTRTPAKLDRLRALGAEPVLCDVFDVAALSAAVRAFGPDAVVHQLTDLPDDVTEIATFGPRNARIRTEGTENLLAAAEAGGARHLLVQSIAWTPPGGGEVVARHERAALAAGAVVVRYGQLYGPGTYYEGELPAHPRIHVDAAVNATPPLIWAEPGVVELAERR